MGEWELENRDKRSRHPDEARSRLDAWILNQGGATVVAKKLGVHHVTVYAWIARRAQPNIETTAKLLKMSRNELTLEDIIESTRSA